MIQCTKMTNSLTNLCDFRGLSFPFLPAVTMLYAALMRHVMNCFDRFGHCHNSPTHVATCFHTLFPLSPRSTDTHHSGLHFSRVGAVQIPLAVPSHSLLKQREERDLDSPTTMSVHHRQPTLGRLMIPPNLGSQQPNQTSMFSPSLPTAIQQGFNPPFVGPIPGNVMTPMQANFMPTLPTAGRPINHRAHASIAQLAVAGLPPPIGIPLTPLLPGQFPQGIPPMLMHAPPFQPRSRRAPSVSTGGPPKAVLGGPGAKNRVTIDAAPTPVITAPIQKAKKVVVNIPRETIPPKEDEGTQDDEEPPRREIWARTPLRPSEIPQVVDTVPPEATSACLFPSEEWRNKLPPTVDVFLPGKVCDLMIFTMTKLRFRHRLLGTSTKNE